MLHKRKNIVLLLGKMLCYVVNLTPLSSHLLSQKTVFILLKMTFSMNLGCPGLLVWMGSQGSSLLQVLSMELLVGSCPWGGMLSLPHSQRRTVLSWAMPALLRACGSSGRAAASPGQPWVSPGDARLSSSAPEPPAKDSAPALTVFSKNTPSRPSTGIVLQILCVGSCVKWL